MTTHVDTLTIVRNAAHALIRDRVREDIQTARLNDAIYDAVNKLGVPVDSLSHETGLTPAKIREIASTPRELDLPALMGVTL